MARNAVQFQKGLSFAEFIQRYGTEEQCHAALIAMRWPDGFECPKCSGAKHSYATALSGDVQIDDAYLGGEKAGKTGRGAANKTPFVIAVATRNGKPVHTQLRRLEAFTKTAIREYAAANIEAASWVVNDGLRCFLGLAEAGMHHITLRWPAGKPAL